MVTPLSLNYKLTSFVSSFLLVLCTSILQKEAIGFAWELLVDVYKLPKDRLYVTYFGGNAELNLPSDEETKQLWLDIG